MSRATVGGLALAGLVLPGCVGAGTGGVVSEVVAEGDVRVARATPAGIAFTDVTADAGLGGQVQQQLAVVPNCLFSDPDEVITGESLTDCEEERMSGSVAAADVDLDGWTDLYLTRLDGPDSLYRNRGDGTFEDVTATSGLAETTRGRTNGAGFADLTGDGAPELYLTTIAEPRFLLFANDGSGRFREEALERGAALVDDRPRSGFSVTFGDVDRDGWIDIHTTEWLAPIRQDASASTHARLLRNLGAEAPGHFEDVTEEAGVVLEGQVHPSVGLEDLDVHPNFSFASSLVDLDADGWQDLLVAGDFGTSQLFWSRGDGTFAQHPTSGGLGDAVNAMGSTVGDVDADGDLDWFVSAIQDSAASCSGRPCNPSFTGNRLYLNDGGRRFVDVSERAGVRDGGWAWGTGFLDVDNDGRLDIVLTNGYSMAGTGDTSMVVAGNPIRDTYAAMPGRLWHARDDGTFVDVAQDAGMTSTAEGRGLAVLDHDRDGDQDVVVVTSGGAPILYRNDTVAPGGWLQLDVRGGPHDAVAWGAVVEVVVAEGDAPRRYEVGAATHFLGQSEAIVHVGVGDAESVAQVTVRWPASGRELTLDDVAVGRRLLVQEPTA